MSEFLDAATSPVGLVFGVPLALCLVLWAVSIIGFLDLDVDVDTDAGEGVLGEAFDSLGIAGVPPLVVASMVSLIAWFVAIVGQIVVVDPVDGVAAVAVGVVVVAVALVAGIFGGARLARPLGAAMVTARAPDPSELAGQPAVVRSGRVDESFGYADADWPDGSQSRVEIRDDRDRGLAPGEQIRLVEYDRDHEHFTVARERDFFPDSGD
ncbi:MAG: hypothetical protein AAFZ07_11650 [Actinomycetota bacterium]